MGTYRVLWHPRCRHHLGGPFVLMAGKGHVLCGTAELVDDIARVLNTVQPRAS